MKSLDASFYTDPVNFAAERERIFRPAWWLLGPAQSCQKPGEYMCDTVCGWQVLVVRGKDGVLRGFHNHCRHRGARLLEAGSGSCRVIKCPYHGWGYDTSGALIATPGFSEEAGIDRATLGLQPLHVTEWRSMIFICVDPDPQPFSDWVGSLDAMLDDLPGIDVMEFHGRFDVHGDANWKTYCLSLIHI